MFGVSLMDGTFVGMCVCAYIGGFHTSSFCVRAVGLPVHCAGARNVASQCNSVISNQIQFGASQVTPREPARMRPSRRHSVARGSRVDGMIGCVITGHRLGSFGFCSPLS